MIGDGSARSSWKIKSQLMGACRGYKDINMLAIQLLNPGGVLLTFSSLQADDHRFISENHSPMPQLMPGVM